MSNGSLDFLNMIKNSGSAGNKPEKKTEGKTEVGEKRLDFAEKKDTCIKNNRSVGSTYIAVIDTETNWHNEVMSVGVAIASADKYKCVDKAYYIINPEYRVGGFFSAALHVQRESEKLCSREDAMSEICSFLDSYEVTKIFAYNAKFDYSHLKELSDYEWFDIMRLAAYKQYNTAIPDDHPCCKTGRLKTDYGVEPIMCLLTGDRRYMETHNAVLDAEDELKIMELLGKRIEEYNCGRVSG